MLGVPSLQKIPTQLIVVFIIFSITIIIAGLYQFQTDEKKFMDNMHQELAAISDLKVKQIVNWRNERLADGQVLSANPLLPRYIQKSMDKKTTESERKDILGWMDSVVRNYHYSSVYLVDRQGKILLSMPKEGEGLLASQSQEMIFDSMDGKKIIMSELHSKNGDHSVCINLVTPVVSESNEDVLGVLVLCVDVNYFLFPFLQEWPMPSDSAESFLVRREGEEVVFLSELRHRKYSALSLRESVSLNNSPSVKAAKGQKGFVEGVDYRGKPVFAFVRPVPGTKWSLIAKVDKEEVMIPFREQSLISATLIGILITQLSHTENCSRALK